MIEMLHTDCMDYMATLPDNAFDLAIVDPPYGIKQAGGQTGGQGKLKKRIFNNGKIDRWDKPPTKKYWEELFRVSKNQVVWGGNYFPCLWENGCKGFVFWYKGNPVPNFSDGELAWTSFNKVARQFDYRYYGNLEGDSSASEKVHPTQKPVALYEWLLKNYAKQGDKILDTHVGSASSLIACHNLGFQYVGFELDKEYYEKSLDRLETAKKQVSILDVIEKQENTQIGMEE